MNMKHEIQNTKYKIQNTKYKIRNTKYKIQNKKHKIQNTKCKTQNMKHCHSHRHLRICSAERPRGYPQLDNRPQLQPRHMLYQITYRVWFMICDIFEAYMIYDVKYKIWLPRGYELKYR